MDKLQPKGFWSYARGDDKHLDSQLTQLRSRVAGEISHLLGREVDMFQDIYDIRTGDDWAEKLRAEVTGASFLVPILTPRYFERDWCREEVMTFIQLAKDAKQKPMIFPIYFTRDRPTERGDLCDVRKAVARYNYFDYRALRFEDNPVRIAKAVNEFAEDVVDALEGGVPPMAVKPAKPSRKQSAKASEATDAPAQSEFTPDTPKLPTLVVDQWPGRGDHTTIGAAIKAAEPGSRILVKPGTYEENLVLDKVLELIGDGSADDIGVSVTSGNTIKVTAPLGRVKNIRFLRNEGGGTHVAALITSGRFGFADCIFTSKSASCVEVIGAGTAPSFTRCRFEDSIGGGLKVREQAMPKLEDCEFLRNEFSGIDIKTGADPKLRRCVFSHNKASGAYVYEAGRGHFEECEFSHNTIDGVTTKGGSAPILITCELTDNWAYGFRTLEKIDVGTLENCHLSGNKRGNWDLAKGSEANVIRRDNTEG